MIIYIDMDDVLCDYTSSHKESTQNNPELEYPQSQAGFFENLSPIEKSIESVNLLRSIPDCDVYILTAPSTRNPLSYTEKRLWVENHFDYEFTKNLILCSNKALLKGDVLVDDNIEGRGQEDFEGNVIHFGSTAYPSWESVIASIKNQG
jgi:5'-nucleotidase